MINNLFNGIVEEIGFCFLQICEFFGKLFIILNGEVRQFQNYNIDFMWIIEFVVISYKEDFEWVYVILEKVCDMFNDEFCDLLKWDEFFNVMELF